MGHEKINGILRHKRLPDESADYIAKRGELRVAEIALMRPQQGVRSFNITSQPEFGHVPPASS